MKIETYGKEPLLRTLQRTFKRREGWVRIGVPLPVGLSEEEQ